MAQFDIRLMFEWGGPCLWAMNAAARTAWGGYANLEASLPLSGETRARLIALTRRHDGALNWSDPGGPSPWTKAEFDDFEKDALALLEVLRSELGDDFRVWYEPVGAWGHP